MYQSFLNTTTKLYLKGETNMIDSITSMEWDIGDLAEEKPVEPIEVFIVKVEDFKLYIALVTDKNRYQLDLPSEYINRFVLLPKKILLNTQKVVRLVENAGVEKQSMKLEDIGDDIDSESKKLISMFLIQER